MRNTRPAFFAFLVMLHHYWSGESFVHAARNITVDDTDPSILYLPAGSWHSSLVPCSFCLNPDPSLAHQNTFHDGTHIIPTTDADDLPSVSSSAPHPSASPNAGNVDDDNDDDDHNQKGKDNDNDKAGKGSRSKRDNNPFFTNKFDSDDPEFVDPPVFVQFNFTGSAIYLYCLVPQGIAPKNTTPTSVNLSFTLDGQSKGSYLHTGSASASGFQPNVTVFTAEDLHDVPHVLQVNVGPDSVFLFDYLIYTQSSEEDTAQSSTAPGVQFTSSPSTSTEDEATRRHNIATFAGAVGGSVGVLFLLSLGIAVSLYRRRLLSVRRERRERARSSDQESLHTNGSEDSPPMQGPAPFVPRYFPGTIPSAPPPYVPRASLSLSSPASTTLSSYHAAAPYTPLLSHPPHPDTSYADLPPSTPPPLDDVVICMPPPPFGEAIALDQPVMGTSVTPPPGILTRRISVSESRTNGVDSDMDQSRLSTLESPQASSTLPLLDDTRSTASHRHDTTPL